VETVAFYSYKGGVGRSLLLANAARFLATLGKGVVALDFDFEAPGLHYKFGAAQDSELFSRLGGAVPYLIATAEGAASPPPLEAHTILLPVPTDADGWLRLMPAGPAPNQKYWTAFKELGEKLRLADPSGQGFMALLDLQARIADELKPDYLLIDARTGVTELGGLATTILADTVVCMFVGNQESLDGTLTVVEALKAAPRLKDQKPIRVVPVLSRAKPPDNERFASGVKRLLELGEGNEVQSKSEPALFALPHDDVLGASEKIVGGERKASAFSPLYKAYLELFQKLFPSRAEPAKQVLDRLEAIADITAELTGGRREHYAYDELLSPWSSEAILEGVLCSDERHRRKGSRYADLLCRSEHGSPLMVVEYVADGNDRGARECWSQGTTVRCAVLLVKGQYRPQRQIFTRQPDGEELHRTERWDLPRPREFDLVPDVGERSVDSMLDAVRHGHIEAVTWLVNEWQDSLLAARHMHPRSDIGHWRPERAQRILDGLAATEDLRCAEEILRRAATGENENLFGSLFWRLPVEAVLKVMESKHNNRFEILSLAGYRLLAHELMGLHYDPDRNALDEARALTTCLPILDDRDAEDDRELMWLRQKRGELCGRVQLSDEAPPTLVWEEALREEPYWRGTLEEARQKFGDKVRKLLASKVSLRSRLRGAAERHELATQGLLGAYEVSGRIELYPQVITAAAEVLGLSPRYLKSVVFIHLSAWALAHEARDLDGQLGYGFAPSPRSGPFNSESPSHVTLVQAFTDRLIRRLKDPNLQAAFEKLSQHQPEPYTRWAPMRKVPLEKLRMLLLTARASAPALGLPGAGEGG
jgi:CobQ/CobB/MinD/ParA nucleotide binding domain